MITNFNIAQQVDILLSTLQESIDSCLAEGNFPKELTDLDVRNNLIPQLREQINTSEFYQVGADVLEYIAVSFLCENGYSMVKCSRGTDMCPETYELKRFS